MKTLLLYLLTAVAEIVGCYLPYLWLREGRSAWLLLPAAASLALFAWLLTLHPAASGRVYAAYGGVYVGVAILWGMAGKLLQAGGGSGRFRLIQRVASVWLAVVAVTLNHFKNPEVHLRLRHIRPNGRLMGEITAISIPSIIMSCISSLTCFVMNMILIAYSSTAVAVFGVYFKLQSFVFMPVFGLNNGMVPIIAYNYGAQKPERIHKTIRLGMVYAVAIMVIGLLVFQLIPKELLLMFDASDAMLEIGAPALRIMSLAFVFAGIGIVSGSACQAFGYSVYSMLISIARQIVVLIPAAYLLSLTGVLRSIWFAFPIAEIFSLILSLFFLRTTLKKTGMALPKAK